VCPRAEQFRIVFRFPSLHPKPLDPKTGPITLETVKLGKSYGGGLWRKDRVVAAAQDVNLQVRRGETLGIVGESGSGKTTVARGVARLIAPSAGAIRVNDIDIAPLHERQLRPYRRRVHVVFQDPYRSLNPRRGASTSPSCSSPTTWEPR
jgi:peptide/nickel transport system ATP-binding protein